MRKLIFILFVGLLPFFSKAQTANAGSDVTIYLTSTSTATLDGSGSSGDSYQWTEVSTDYMSGGTITSPTSKVTTITGLPQGVFYFQLVTTGATTKTDTMVVRVHYATLPLTATKVEELPITNLNFISLVNNRDDTTNYTGYGFPNNFHPDTYGNSLYLERSRSNGLSIDGQKSKLYSTIEDGYAWNGSSYARSEMTYGAGFPIDTSKIYCIEWKGYYPQPDFYLDQSGVTYSSAITMMQIHSNDDHSPPLGFNIGYHGNIWVGESIAGSDALLDSLTIAQYSDFVNKTHTLRVYYKESKGDGGFVKVLIDGVQKYYRAGAVGSTWGSDYFKMASNYDFGNRIVDVNNHTRHRKFSLVTEAYNLYTVTDTSAAAPTISISGDQVITDNHTSVSATASWAGGQGGSYLWTKISGGSANIESATNSSTNITGLQTGTYIFRCTFTQDGQTVYKDVVIVVAIPTGITNFYITRTPKAFTNE